MSPNLQTKETITLTVKTGNSIVYNYDGVTESICNLTGPSLPGPGASVDYVFKLDEASVAAHWTMTGCRLANCPLQFIAGTGDACTSYTVHDPGGSDKHWSWSFEYTNTQTRASFWNGEIHLGPDAYCGPPDYACSGSGSGQK